MRLIIIILALLGSSLSQASDRSQTEQWGDNIQILIPASALMSTIFLESPRCSSGTGQWFKAFVTFELVTEGLKYLTHKERPHGGFKSFPSGHSAAAFMGAGFIHQRYGFNKAIPAYMGAVFVAYSRVNAGKHYREDVFAGAAIGLASTMIFVKPYEYKGFKIKPNLSHQGIMLGFEKEW